MKFTQAEEKYIAYIEQKERDNDHGRLKRWLQDCEENDELFKPMFQFDEHEMIVLRPDAKQWFVNNLRRNLGINKLYKTLKRHFGRDFAIPCLHLLSDRKLPPEVLLQLNIEVDQLIARRQSSDDIWQYLQASATPTLLTDREIKALNEERIQSQQERETERQLRIQSQQERETARQLRIQSQQERETERQLRIQAEQECARLRQLLEQRLGTTIFNVLTSQTAQSTPTSSTAFWQTAQTDSTKKRGFEATDTRQLEAEAQAIEQPSKRATLDPSSPISGSPDDADTNTTRVSR